MVVHQRETLLTLYPCVCSPEGDTDAGAGGGADVAGGCRARAPEALDGERQDQRTAQSATGGVQEVSIVSPVFGCITYLFTHVRTLRAIPRNAIVVCLLPGVQSGPNSTQEPPFLVPWDTSRLFWSSPNFISGWGPAHFRYRDRHQWHSVNMPNPPPSSLIR